MIIYPWFLQFPKFLVLTVKQLKVLFENPATSEIVWLVLDIVLINIAFVLAYWVRYDLQLFRAVDPAFAVTYEVYLPFVALFTLLLIVVYRQQGVYQLRRQISWFDEFYAIISGTATCAVMGLAPSGC